jgi:hypothetical protein
MMDMKRGKARGIAYWESGEGLPFLDLPFMGSMPSSRRCSSP